MSQTSPRKFVWGEAIRVFTLQETDRFLLPNMPFATICTYHEVRDRYVRAQLRQLNKSYFARLTCIDDIETRFCRRWKSFKDHPTVPFVYTSKLVPYSSGVDFLQHEGILIRCDVSDITSKSKYFWQRLTSQLNCLVFHFMA